MVICVEFSDHYYKFFYYAGTIILSKIVRERPYSFVLFIDRYHTDSEPDTNTDPANFCDESGSTTLYTADLMSNVQCSIIYMGFSFIIINLSGLII